ncbi:hypothetical protein IKG02_03255 [Candidatus Saccharibacteria bacterium]|nr:hypothetical protein [Candidatus Saccharibacteria bacterium]
MEEKLYFTPADYGRNKKHPEKPGSLSRPTKKEKLEVKHKTLKWLVFCFFVMIITAVLFWLLHEKTTTNGQYPENIKNESLVCKSDSIIYEKINQVKTDSKELVISMIFNGKETLSSGSLKYTLKYSSYDEAHDAEAISHAQFNLGLQELGFDVSKFNNKFSIIDNELVVVLNFSTKNEINETTRSYLLLNYNDGDNKLPSTLPEYRQNYEQQGFFCVSTTD